MVRFLIAAAALGALSCSDAFLPALQGQASPIVVITFDDADQSVYSVGYALMRQTDTVWTATHFFPNSYIGVPGNVSLDEEKEMERAGWESGGHGWEHDNLTAMPPDSAAWRIKAAYDFLVQNGLAHESWAYASGMYDDTVKAMIARYFVNIRTAHDYYYLGGVDRKELGYFAVKGTFTSDDIISRVEEARRLGAPLVVIGFHVIQPDTAAPVPVYYCKESAFRGFLSYIKDQQLRVMSVRDAMKILCGS
jgi:peptidoglycan/xylan/chitin deacetylase (PgdA/CDA1 family)